MKSQIIEAFGVYNTDDRGYNAGKPISIWPIRAAAEAQKTDGYKNVYPVKILKIEDLSYILKKEIDVSSIIGKIPAYETQLVYCDYIYNDGFDKSKYYTKDKDILNVLQDFRNHTIISHYMIFDTEKYFILEYPEPIKTEKIVPSRDLAIKHALSKLTKEEKDLLGL